MPRGRYKIAASQSLLFAGEVTMKKIFIILIAIVLICVAGLGIFIATFNADRYRPALVEKVSQSLGVPVDLGRISLVWKNGVALRLENLTIYSGPEKQTASVKFQEASAVVRLGPLLRKDVQIASVIVTKPIVRLVKGANGKIEPKGVRMVPSQGPNNAAVAKTSPGSMLFSVDSFRIENGELFFEDPTSSPPVGLVLRDLDVEIKGFSLSRPFSFKAAAAIFSPRQNLRLSGRFLIPQGSNAGSLDTFSITTNLAELDLKELSHAIPAVASVGIQERLAGDLTLKINHLELDSKGIGTMQGDLTIQNGRLKPASTKSPLENIQLAAFVNGEDLTVKKFTADFAGGTLKASGMVKQFRTQGFSGFSFSSSDLDIDGLMPDSPGQNEPKLGGRLSLSFEGQSSGLTWPQISHSLTGQGQIGLKDGALLNYNVLREVLRKISIMPGADEAIQTRLPGIYRAKMNEPSTLLRPVNMPIRILNGQIIIDQLLLQTDFLTIQGGGLFGLDKSISAKTYLQLDRDLSASLASSVPQIQLLLNAQGQIEVPVQIQGQFPRILVLPDTDFITQKVLASKAQEMVANLLDKPVATGEAGVQNSVQGLFGSKNGLRSLLSQAVRGDQSSGGGQ
jgi:hypothetical protein